VLFPVRNLLYRPRSLVRNLLNPVRNLLLFCHRPLMDMRKKYQEEFIKRHGIKLGFMSPFLKVSCHAHPSNSPRCVGWSATWPLLAAWKSVVELTVTLLQAKWKRPSGSDQVEAEWKLTE
jgi:hypothetical protein